MAVPEPDWSYQAGSVMQEGNKYVPGRDPIAVENASDAAAKTRTQRLPDSGSFSNAKRYAAPERHMMRDDRDRFGQRRRFAPGTPGQRNMFSLKGAKE